MQATYARSMGEKGVNLMGRVSTSARLMHHASPAALVFPQPIAAELTLAQRIARYGLTILAIVALSALFASQVAATLR